MAYSFINYKKQKIILGEGAFEHIFEAHPEVSLKDIEMALKNPDEVRMSSYKNDSELYYTFKTKNRYICVIVKICKDGNFISTALTTTKPKAGRILYKKEAE
ncbi:MAG TPA: PBECR2 nuclease fold domain-containing protein [Gammaproteobacteria bacterium]|nr:PBECR2 nuclease fold domain-containing protein [Gammaproteobacteria bacterium]